MATLYYGPQQLALSFVGGNLFLATLQAATVKRFNDTGRGFALTLAGTLDGDLITNSHWLHPSIPMWFEYDAETETGEQPETVVVMDEDLETMLDVMDRPIGVLWGFEPEGPYSPFVVEGEAPDDSE